MVEHGAQWSTTEHGGAQSMVEHGGAQRSTVDHGLHRFQGEWGQKTPLTLAVGPKHWASDSVTELAHNRRHVITLPSTNSALLLLSTALFFVTHPSFLCHVAQCD